MLGFRGAGSLAAMTDLSSNQTSRSVGLRRGLVEEWREIGGLGRVGLIGVLAAAALSIALGFSITRDARGHLLDARAEIIEIIAADLMPILEQDPSLEVGGAFDVAARQRLLGGETVQVKLWLPDGTVAWSDDPSVVGERFRLLAPALAAFRGERATLVSDLTDPAHAEHVHLESLIEFYFPFVREDGEVTVVLEVEQRTDRLEAALGKIERDTWLSIGSGLGALGVFLGVLALSRVRDLNRRRRRAEELLGALLNAQEEERTHIIGALHDDIGQRLYRLLYGIEGTRDRMEPEDPLREQLGSLTQITREIDTTLRAELKILHKGLVRELGLAAAVTAVADAVRAESGLEVNVTVDLEREPDEVPARVLARAAGEALTNVRRHADATRVDVAVESRGDQVYLTVTDDGKGISTEPGLGLTTTRERLEALGGRLMVGPGPEGGTVFRAQVPQVVAT